MPYIHPRYRVLLESEHNQKPQDCGELNYAITRLVNDYIIHHGLKYGSINEIIGVLECAKLELYRRIAAPYEDTKIVENGDVYQCK
jgi:broad-specificity NMP kinase